ncbi:MAG: hypothetical protein ABR956_06895 [Terracidiphilus sp.]|jgi:hypothetical protein
MVDYAKLVGEEKARQDSTLSLAEIQKRREVDLVALFRDVQIALGEEVAKANAELSKRGAATISGPFRPVIGEERIELALGAVDPSCRVTIQSTKGEVALSRIVVELFGDTGASIAQSDYITEDQVLPLKVYKSLVEGFPDKSVEMTPAAIAQEIVPAIIRGRFA